ncbi:ABC transporter ATP-binding protein [Aquabacterium sp.]|uniref:ABC transporter ATP-binding protein n=1 Tax=Aquabacterium sp. TaxID=1872578 RepID=UPI002BCD014C|nr:ABC transporter ATP-binding protein [Aquabacterium sp.]HSW08384.1 ABC transporter ATP-binding protein [Aquabacterium sp.]
MTTVVIQSLVKRYGATTAVDGISLQIEHGEFISLLGPSGCGKTTTLRCLAGFETIDEGRILFDGRDVAGLPPEERDIGMVFQSYALFPHMTVAGNLAFGLEMRRLRQAEIDRRVRAVLDLVQLGGLGARYPRELSGGQQQRVALARALVIEPKILLLDEPLANLDATLRDEMRTFIRDLQKRVGISTLYVTHDQAEAMTMSDRVVVMFGGRIAQAASPEVVYDMPASAAVARFVGQANVVPGVVGVRADGLPAIHSPVGLLPLPLGLQLAIGTRLSVVARPQAIGLSAARAANSASADGAAAGGVAANIAARYFHGAFIDYRVAVGGQMLSVQAPAPARHQAGDEVQLGFDAARLWAVEAA